MMVAMAGRGAYEKSHLTGIPLPDRPLLRAAGSPRGNSRGAAELEALGNPSTGEVKLVSRPGAGGTARRLIAEVLRTWNLETLAETCELLVSELIGNAVRHAGAPVFGLRITQRGGTVRVEVRDPSRALPCLVPIVRDLDENGRGLFLVNTLADRWGAGLQPRGKVTWFELRAPQ